MGKITSYPKADQFEINKGDTLLVSSGTVGTRGFYATHATRMFAEISTSLVPRRNTCLSRDLGSEVTSEMVSEILSGSFRHLLIGNYFTFEHYSYAIADINYYYGNYTDLRSSFAPQATPSDEIIEPIGNHLVMIVRSFLDDPIPTVMMNDADTTEGGYPQSKLYTEYLDPIREAIETDFGDLVIPFTQIYPTDAAGTSYEYITDTVFPLSEVNVYGFHAFGRPDIFSRETKQYSIYKMSPNYHQSRSYWLRDIASSTEFAYHEGCGMCAKAPASTPGTPIVAFLIGQKTMSS